MITPTIKIFYIFRRGHFCRSLSPKTVVKRQNDVKKKDGFGGEHLKKSDESYNSMNAVPGAFVLTNLAVILNINASTKMMKRNEYHGKSKKRR